MKEFKGVIFFDLDDTLFYSSEFVNYARNESFKAMIDEGLQVKIDKLWELFWKIYQKFGSNYSYHYNEILNMFGIDKREAHRYIAIAVLTYHRAKKNIFKYKPNGINIILKTLKKEGYLLGIISSGIGIKQWEKIYRLDYEYFFQKEHVYITQSINHEKNYNMYKTIFEHYKSVFATENIWMVGDKESADINPAKQAGFKTIRVKGNGKYSFDYNHTVGDYKIESVSELLNLKIF